MYYPILLDLKGVPVLVVGGGRVALRKTRGLKECGARVRVVTLRAISEIKRMKGIRLEERGFRLSDLKGVRLVVAATSCGRTNRKISAACRSRGILVNVVDDRELSGFILPAVVRRGDLLIAVSTQGAAPFVAADIARGMREKYGKDHALWLEKMRQARRTIMEKVASPAGRKRLLAELLKPTYFKMIEKGDMHAFDRRVERLTDEAR